VPKHPDVQTPGSGSLGATRSLVQAAARALELPSVHESLKRRLDGVLAGLTGEERADSNADIGVTIRSGRRSTHRKISATSSPCVFRRS
jgi:hypothetical protein